MALAGDSATPTQAAALPPLGQHESLVVLAPTGTGKTLVAAAAACRVLAGGASAPRAPRVLVLCPTRELTEQFAGVMAAGLEGLGARVVDFYGSPSARRDTLALARPVDCVVATPGRALELVRRGALSYDDVRLTVLDEVDHLLGASFGDQTRTVLAARRGGRAGGRTAASSGDTLATRPQLLALSATSSPELLGELTGLHGEAPHVVRVDSSPTTETQPRPPVGVVIAAPGPARSDLLVDLARRARSALFFVPRKDLVPEHVALLAGAGLAADGLSGNASPTARRAALRRLSDGEITALVATDVAARGLDFDALDLVVHLGPPHSAEDLVHRSGRTGRGDRPAGAVLAVVAPGELEAMRRKARSAQVSLTEPVSPRAAGELVGPVVNKRDTREPRRGETTRHHRVDPSSRRGGRSASTRGRSRGTSPKR